MAIKVLVSGGSGFIGSNLIMNALKHYHFFEEVEHPIMEKTVIHGPSFRLTDTDYELGRSNLIGEHNDYVYTKLLGLSDYDLANLVAEGVI